MLVGRGREIVRLVEVARKAVGVPSHRFQCQADQRNVALALSRFQFTTWRIVITGLGLDADVGNSCGEFDAVPGQVRQARSAARRFP